MGRRPRVVISNTGLPYNPDVPDDVLSRVRDFRANAKTPTLPEMAQALQNVPDAQAIAFAYWQKFCWETEDMPVGFMMSMTTERRPQWRMALPLLLNRLGLGSLRPSTPVGAAYEAPFPDGRYKAAVQIMPYLVPSQLRENEQIWREVYERWDKPFLVAFTDSDPITAGGEQTFLERVPTAQNVTIRGAGHFVQEDAGPELAQLMVDFMQGRELPAQITLR